MNGIPIHHEYTNFLIQAYDWDEVVLAELRYPLEDKFLKLIEEYLGYSESEFWFGYVLGYEPPYEFGAFDPRIDGTWKFQVEKAGRIVYAKNGYNKDL